MRRHHATAFLASEQAIAAIEYALLSGLIALVILGSIKLVANETSGLWNVISNCVALAVVGISCN